MDIQPPSQPESDANPPIPPPPEPGQVQKPKSKSVYPTPTAPSFFTPSPGLSEGVPKESETVVQGPVITQPGTPPPKKPNKPLIIVLIALLIFGLGIGTGIMIHANLSADSAFIDTNETQTSEVSTDEKTEQQTQEPADDVDIWARNNHRKADINAIHASLETYFADRGYYPPESVFANEATAKAALPGLGTDDLEDPYDRFINSADSDYLYSVDGCSAQCDTYELATLLEGGEGTYNKNSLN